MFFNSIYLFPRLNSETENRVICLTVCWQQKNISLPDDAAK